MTPSERQHLIARGKLWVVYADATPDMILFEGSRTACLKYVRTTHGLRAYRNGRIRIGQLIWEKQT